MNETASTSLYSAIALIKYIIPLLKGHEAHSTLIHSTSSCIKILNTPITHAMKPLIH